MTAPAKPPRTRRTLGALGIAGILWFALTFLAMHVIQPELDPLRALGSEYANGRLGWLMSLGFVMAGLGTLALAVGLRRSLPDARRIGLATGLLAVAALGFVGSGVFPTDIPLEDGTVGYTFNGKMHAIAGLVLFAPLITAAFLLAGIFRREPGWSVEGRRTRAVAWILLLGFPITLLLVPLQVGGLLQRISVSIMLAWLMGLGLWVRRDGRSPGPEPEIGGSAAPR